MTNKISTENQTFINAVFAFFLILIVVITNLRYSPALDKELEIRILTLSGFLLAIVLISVFNKKNQFNIININALKNPFVILYGVYTLLTGISYFYAYNTGEALYEFLKLCTYFIMFLYVMLYVLPKPKSREMFLISSIIFSVIIGLLGIIQALNFFPAEGFSVKTTYMITGNFAHKNMFSQILLISFSFALYGIYFFKNYWRAAAIFGAVSNLLLIAVLMTRSVWVAMMFSGIVTFIVYQFVFQQKKTKSRFLPNSVIYTLGGIIIVGALTYLSFNRLDPDSFVRKHIIEATDFKSGNTYHRVNIWKKSLDIVKEHPLIGVGAGNWKIEISKHNVTLYDESGGWIVPRRTHNDYINVIAETGIVGLLLFLTMFGLALIYLIKTLKRAKTKQDKLFILILFFALLGYMTFSFFSFSKERIEAQIFLNMIFAFIIYEYNHRRNTAEQKVFKNYKVRTIGFIALIPLLLMMYVSYERLKVETALHKIYAYSKTNSKQAVQQSYVLSNNLRSPFISLSPMNDPLYSIKAINMLKLKLNIHEIAEVYEKALDDFPFHVKTLNETAYVYSLAGNESLALQYSAQAYEYAPDNRKVHLDHVVHLEKAGKTDEAYEVITRTPPNTTNPRYKKILYALLINKMKALAEESGNETLAREIKRIAKNPDLVLKLYTDSRKNFKTYENVFLNQVIRNVKKSNPEALDSVSESFFKKNNINANNL